MSDILARLNRWIEHIGEPIGAGRANPDNEILYLLMDARDEIAALRTPRTEGEG